MVHRSEDENEDDVDYETKSQMRMHKINTHQLAMLAPAGACD